MVNKENQPKSCIIVTKNHQVARFQHQKWQIGKESNGKYTKDYARCIKKLHYWQVLSRPMKRSNKPDRCLCLCLASQPRPWAFYSNVFSRHITEKNAYSDITPTSTVRKGTLWWFEEDLFYGAWWELNWLSWKKDVRWTVIMAQALGIPAWIFDQNHTGL